MWSHSRRSKLRPAKTPAKSKSSSVSGPKRLSPITQAQSRLANPRGVDFGYRKESQVPYPINIASKLMLVMLSIGLPYLVYLYLCLFLDKPMPEWYTTILTKGLLN